MKGRNSEKVEQAAPLKKYRVCANAGGIIPLEMRVSGSTSKSLSGGSAWNTARSEVATLLPKELRLLETSLFTSPLSPVPFLFETAEFSSCRMDGREAVLSQRRQRKNETRKAACARTADSFARASEVKV